MKLPDLKIQNVLVLDDVLTQEQCDYLINNYKDKLDTTPSNTHLGYEYIDYDCKNDEFMMDLTRIVTDKYSDTFPWITTTQTLWGIGEWRIKRFPPGNSFGVWHCEQNIPYERRVMCMIVYLTDNNCGTEFMATNEIVESKRGRVVIFPTQWTHAHRGHPDPDGKERWIMSAYGSLTNFTIRPNETTGEPEIVEVVYKNNINNSTPLNLSV
jgi:2OG-Fe(II) oxygenase superfamily